MTRADGIECDRCEGYGTSSELAPCTSFGAGCACNGPRVEVTCPDCDGFGTVPSGQERRDEG